MRAQTDYKDIFAKKFFKIKITLTGVTLAFLIKRLTLEIRKRWFRFNVVLGWVPTPVLKFSQVAARLTEKFPPILLEDAAAPVTTLLGFPLEKIQCTGWHTDDIQGFTWSKTEWYWHLKTLDFEVPRDVKIPWEKSRFHWLIPQAHAYLKNPSEPIAFEVRRLLMDWMANNKFCFGVNWLCAMEVSIRAVTWLWLISVFHKAQSWQGGAFIEALLSMLYKHQAYLKVHVEYSKKRSNHFNADWVGLFLLDTVLNKNINLNKFSRVFFEEILLQTTADGVNYEGSPAYHNLNLEIFHWGVWALTTEGATIPDAIMDRLQHMQTVSEALRDPLGEVVQFGDEDRGAFLPVRNVLPKISGTPLGTTTIFPQGGYARLQHGTKIIFIDFAGVGLEGLGGHGHNDRLSFELWDGTVKIISDTGSPPYTPYPTLRNTARAMSAHNVLQVDDVETFQPISPQHLWHLIGDKNALPVTHTETSFTAVAGYWTRMWEFGSASQVVITDTYKEPLARRLRIYYIFPLATENFHVTAEPQLLTLVFLGRKWEGKSNRPMLYTLEPHTIYKYGEKNVGARLTIEMAHVDETSLVVTV